MKKESRNFGAFWRFVPLILLGIFLTGVPKAWADEKRPRQFTDEEYRANGIEPSKLIDKLVGSDGRSFINDEGDIEIAELTGGFNHTGARIYYSVLSKINEDAFAKDEAGKRAREIADEFVAYIFPKASGAQFVPAFPNRRQDNLFDTRGGYFSNNPLGLWRLAFVKWVEVESTPHPEICRELRGEMMVENGPDLDGTPIIDEVNDIQVLEDNGCVLIRSRNSDGTLPPLLEGENGGPATLFRWVT